MLSRKKNVLENDGTDKTARRTRKSPCNRGCRACRGPLNACYFGYPQTSVHGETIPAECCPKPRTVLEFDRLVELQHCYKPKE